MGPHVPAEAKDCCGDKQADEGVDSLAAFLVDLERLLDRPEDEERPADLLKRFQPEHGAQVDGGDAQCDREYLQAEPLLGALVVIPATRQDQQPEVADEAAQEQRAALEDVGPRHLRFQQMHADVRGEDEESGSRCARHGLLLVEADAVAERRHDDAEAERRQEGGHGDEADHPVLGCDRKRRPSCEQQPCEQLLRRLLLADGEAVSDRTPEENRSEEHDVRHRDTAVVPAAAEDGSRCHVKQHGVHLLRYLFEDLVQILEVAPSQVDDADGGQGDAKDPHDIDKSDESCSSLQRGQFRADTLCFRDHAHDLLCERSLPRRTGDSNAT